MYMNHCSMTLAMFFLAVILDSLLSLLVNKSRCIQDVVIRDLRFLRYEKFLEEYTKWV